MAGRMVSIEVTESERGNFIRYANDGERWRNEVIPGQQGSVNLAQRTRRRLQEIVESWFPAPTNVGKALSSPR